jgi:hypothetical protein
MNNLPPSAPSPPLQAYAVFSDNINQASVQRIFFNFTGAMEKQFKHVHLLFQSSGGFVGDGICLYNFFRSLPIDLTIYNAGAVQSIAAIAYLGAKKRKTSKHGTFMIHRTGSGSQPATRARLKGIERVSLSTTREWNRFSKSISRWMTQSGISSIFKSFTFLPKRPKKIGFAYEIGEFSPPPGIQIYNI